MVKTTLFRKSWIHAGPYSLGTQVGNFAFLSGRADLAGACLPLEISAIAGRA